MTLKKSLLAFLFVFLLAGCGSGILERPSYKPVNFQNYSSVELWKNSSQYQMATVLQNFGMLEVSFGNNGTIMPDTKVDNFLSKGYGVCMVMEINNKEDKGTIIDLSNSNIKDDKGMIWKIFKCTEYIETNRVDSSVKIVPGDNKANITKLFTNNYVQDHSSKDVIQCPGKTCKHLFIYFTSDYLNQEDLPESFTFSIQSGSGTAKITSKFKFDKIDW